MLCLGDLSIGVELISAYLKEFLQYFYIRSIGIQNDYSLVIIKTKWTMKILGNIETSQDFQT